MKSVLVIAPHPDDETLGCGGTLLRHVAEGDAVHWLIATGMSEEAGFSADEMATRSAEIDRVDRAYGFTSVRQLGYVAARLDAIPLADLVADIGDAISDIKPETVYLPHSGDVHSDHRIVAQAAGGATKWFRYPSVQTILAYETLSETEFSLDTSRPFQANYFVDISDYLEKKLEILEIYESEIGEFPFPRSTIAERARAQVHGATIGRSYAEAFVLLKTHI